MTVEGISARGYYTTIVNYKCLPPYRSNMVQDMTPAQRETVLEQLYYDAEQVAQTGVITEAQAQAAFMADVGFTRQEMAEELGKSPNTIDNLRQRGQAKIAAVKEAHGQIEMLAEFIQAAKEMDPDEIEELADERIREGDQE